MSNVISIIFLKLAYKTEFLINHHGTRFSKIHRSSVEVENATGKLDVYNSENKKLNATHCTCILLLG